MGTTSTRSPGWCAVTKGVGAGGVTGPEGGLAAEAGAAAGGAGEAADGAGVDGVDGADGVDGVDGADGAEEAGLTARGAGPLLPRFEDHVGVAAMSGDPLGALGGGGVGADGAGAAGAAAAGGAGAGGVGAGVGAGVTVGLGDAGAAPEEGVPAGDPGRVSMCPRMSCFVTRPAIPVPGTLLMSTLCSAAILRTTGDDRVCRSSSGVISARGFSAGGGAAACGRAGAGAVGAALAGVGGVLARLDANDDAVGVAGAVNAAVEDGVEGVGAAGTGGAGGAGAGAGAAAAGAGGAGVDVTAGVEIPGLAADVPSACPTATDGLLGCATATDGLLGCAAATDGLFGCATATEGAAVAASPSPMTPTTVLIGTVAPGSTRISLSTPEAGAGISASTLSVEISKSGSSRTTRSPTFFIHLVIVPSAIDSPIWGMMTSVI
jgi:hypothetical protein